MGELKKKAMIAIVCFAASSIVFHIVVPWLDIIQVFAGVFRMMIQMPEIGGMVLIALGTAVAVIWIDEKY